MFDLRRLLGKPTGSREMARERLQLVLIHDRASLSPELMDMLKRRIMDVISEFVVIDESGFALDLEQSEDTAALISNIPIKSVKRSAPTVLGGK